MLAEHERANAERVAERDEPVARDQRNDRIRTLHPAMHARHGLEERGRIELQAGARELQFVREHVEQHFGVGRGVDVPAVDAEHLVLQLQPVRQVAVVREDDAERRVHVERLRFFLARRGTGRRIAHLADAHVARQAAHVARAEHVAHHAVGLVHVEIVAVRRGDAGGVLTAMLQEQQAVIDQLIDGALGNYTYDAAHGMSFKESKRVQRRCRNDGCGRRSEPASEVASAARRAVAVPRVASLRVVRRYCAVVRRGAHIRGERSGKQRFQFAHALLGIGPEQRIAPKFLLRQFGQASEGDQHHYQYSPSHEAEQQTQRPVDAAAGP